MGQLFASAKTTELIGAHVQRCEAMLQNHPSPTTAPTKLRHSRDEQPARLECETSFGAFIESLDFDADADGDGDGDANDDAIDVVMKNLFSIKFVKECDRPKTKSNVRCMFRVR